MGLARALIGAVVFALLAAIPARAFETAAGTVWLYDVTTGTVLLSKNADAPLPPASMSKLMTLNMLFEALRDGRVQLDDTFSVSARAKAMGGSTMFLTESDRPTVKDLIQGIIVNSGNDACVVVAEGLAGSEEAFARKMTERAAALGMAHSYFTNSSGWPEPDHRMSMHDLGLLAVRLITEFPEYYPYFAETEFHFAGRSPDNRFNRNPLLGLVEGADGLKTGHTAEAGYGMVGSAVQNGRRVVMVVSGLKDATERALESERLMNWAFRDFAMKTAVPKGTRVAEAEVWMGRAASVGLVPEADIVLLLPSLAQDKLEAEVVYSGPVTAPVKAGQKLADLVIRIPDLLEPITVPLVAEADVARGGFFKRVATAFADVRGRVGRAVGG
ncbi:MAG: D-alanyl-D-alanine carboxypeptidase family protein [Paracoccaceae bacterium]